jgi:hypothetical protein
MHARRRDIINCSQINQLHPRTVTRNIGIPHISFLQVNLQHSRSANGNLMKIIEIEEPDLVLIQEPYEYKNKPVGIEKNRIFTAGIGKHRATILLINTNIDAILMAKLSDEDSVVLEIRYGKKKLFAASMYFGLEEQIENKFHKIDEIIRFAHGEGILIAAMQDQRLGLMLQQILEEGS